MNLTYILVDFENVQPGAADIALVRGEHLRLWIFRGPSQKKYSADVAEAWQPLGASVQFIRCEKAGRNALDMHLAFQLGRLVGEHQHAENRPLPSARFVVVSKDTDYDPLLHYLRSLGCEAIRSPSIKAALGGAAEKHAAKSPKARPAAVLPPQRPAAAGRKAVIAKKTAAPKKSRSAPPKPEASKPVEPRPAAARKTAKLVQAPMTAVNKPATDLVDKAIKHLREHPRSRPGKRKAFEKNIESVLRKKIDPKAVPALVDALEQRGVITITGNRIDYPFWDEGAK